MNIALFLGSFNPIHNGHMNIATDVLDKFDIDQVQLVIAAKNPAKSKDSYIDDKHRLNILNHAVAKHQHVNVNSIEFTLPQPTYSYKTLQAIDTGLNNYFLIMGTDVLRKFKKWKNYNLIANYPIIHVLRDTDRLSYEEYNSFNIIYEFKPNYPFSSTEVRDQIINGDIEGLKKTTPEGCHSYLIEHFNDITKKIK